MHAPARLRRPWSRRTGGVVACALLTVLVVAGALVWWLRPSPPPDIPRPDLPAAQDAACRDLVADLPRAVAGQRAVEVNGATAYGGAWGDPAIVLTCGVGPVDISDAPRCADVDGVGWLVSDQDAEGGHDATFTADGYRPRVRLHVPAHYLPDGGAAALADLAAVVKAHLVRKVPCL